VIANDTLDPDSTAANTISVGSVTVTGPAGESFANTDAQATIVANQIRITLNNANFQQLALGEHATVTVPYTLTGDAGDTSSANLVVTVNGANDVPVAVDDSGTMTEDQSGTAFTVLTNDALDPDHGAPNNVTAGAVTNLSAPSGENIDTGDIGISVNASNQIVVTLGSDFQHMHDGETATFDVAYTLHGDQPGDLATATLHVTVTGANDAPTVSNVTFTGASSANYNTDLIVNDPTDGAPTTTGPFKGITASLLSLSGASDVDGPNPLSFTPLTNVLTADGGHVTLQADGDFIYTPRVGTTATSDSFSFTVTDSNSGVSGPGTATATATITLQGPHIWYVNADGPDGDGSSEHPFSTLAHFAGALGVDHAGDIIFLETASNHYTGGITLENNEQLISQSAGLTVPDGSGGAGTVTLQAASGANVVVDGGVVLGSGNNIQGVDFGATSGFALSGTNVGTVHVDDVTQGVINNASGGGVGIGGGSNVLNMDFGSVTTGGGTSGILVTNASGTFHAHGGTISGASGADVALTGGTLAFTMDGTISDPTGQLVVIQNMTGGTQSFTGNITDTGAGTGGGILLSSNTGATMNFSGGMTLSTGGNTAFTASSGGTVNVTGTNNHLTTTTGTALKVADTTIGASGLTFHDISSNGAATGIILNNTGSGFLHVDGSGANARDGSGGTIQHSTGNGISLTNASNVVLTHMNITSNGATGAGGQGISGTGVNGFIADWDSFSGNGATNAGDGQGAIMFGASTGSVNGLTGTGSGGTNPTKISNSSFANSAGTNISVFNSSGTLTDLQLINNTLTGLGSSPPAGHGGSGFLLQLRGSAVATVDALENAISNSFGAGMQGLALDGTNLTFNVGDGTALNANTFTNDATDDLSLSNKGTGVLVTNILHNTFTNTPGNAIFVGNGTPPVSGSITAKIDGNTITSSNAAASINHVVLLLFSGTSDSHATISNNNITNHGNFDGIKVDSPDAGTSPTYDVKVINNVVTNDATAGNAINLQARRDADAIFKVEGNTTTAPSGIGIQVRQANTATIQLERGVSASGDPAVVLAANNPGATGSIATFIVGTVAVVNNGTGTYPMLAALGGVDSVLGTQGETHLTQGELSSVVAAAIAQWAAAGASPEQIAALQHVTYDVGTTPGGWLAQSSTGHVTVSSDAAGFGWFVDPTPLDSAEFTQSLSATHLVTDPAGAPAGQMDLLTAVMHEMGEQLGLQDTFSSTDRDGLMFVALTTGERRLPGADDVAAATAAEQSGAAAAQTVASGQTVTGTSGADSFVMDPSTILVQQAQTQPIAHVVGYSAAQGDTFDFSALAQTNLPSGLAAALASGDFRVAEDASGTFATLQVHDGAGASDWLSVAQLDGVHAGDPVNVALDAAHVAHLHAAVLV
jgi:hypothetical protein